MRILLSSLIVAAALASPAAAAPSNLTFAVMREGEQIGTHVMKFANSGDELRVDIKTDVQVKVLFVTAYRFAHQGSELWKAGRLVAYTSHTDDDGTAKSLEAKAAGDKLDVTGSAGTWQADAGIVPASLWDQRIVQQSTILNTLDGRPMAVTVTDAGMDQVEVAGQMVPAHHYVMTGDLSRELWYDANGVLSHVRFAGSDGSRIDYARQ